MDNYYMDNFLDEELDVDFLNLFLNGEVNELDGEVNGFLDGLAMENVEKIIYNDKIYYRKQIADISSDTVKRTWEMFYGNDGLLYQLNIPPIYVIDSGKTYLLLPELGEEIPEGECESACKEAQEKLHDIGYHHIDLYDSRGSKVFYNCTNVRKLNGEYYPIDMLKIIKLDKGGKRKTKNKRKTRRINKFKN